jgi:hypothetical protein
MTTPHGGHKPARIALLAIVTLIVTLAPSGAHAAVRHDAFPLHAGSHGQRVQDLQWLLGGHKPYVFNQVKPTFKFKPNGAYGARTKSAVIAMKFRIGYPKIGQCGSRTTLLRDTTTGYFFAILEGKVPRPRCWVALAAQRVKGAVRVGASTTALAIQRLEVSQLGVHEVPDGSNRGPCISTTCRLGTLGLFGPYQGSTGAYGAAWCASFGDWALQSVTGHGFGSANNAYVPTIAEYAQQQNWLAAKPKVGSFVIFLSPDLLLVNAFHIGYVVRVTASGLQTVEGNYANGVHEVWRPFAANRMVYVDVPGVA